MSSTKIIDIILEELSTRDEVISSQIDDFSNPIHILKLKEILSEYVYLTQDRLFKFLANKGIVDQSTIQGGDVFMSMEAKLPENDKYNVPQLALFTIGKFIEEERPTFEYEKALEQEEERRLTEPGPEDSTEFDPARQAAEKGTLKKDLSPYGISAIYRM